MLDMYLARMRSILLVTNSVIANSAPVDGVTGKSKSLVLAAQGEFMCRGHSALSN